MFSGLDIPLRVTGGAIVNWLSERLDLLFVVSSQVTQLGNFIIKRAAMFTFSPITISWNDREHHTNTILVASPSILTSILMPLRVTHHSTEGHPSRHTNRIVLQMQLVEVVEDVLCCPQSPSCVILMLSMWKAKDAKKCTTLQEAIYYCCA